MLGQERAESAQLQAQLTEALNAREQAKCALKAKEQEIEELSDQLTATEEAGKDCVPVGWSSAASSYLSVQVEQLKSLLFACCLSFVRCACSGRPDCK